MIEGNSFLDLLNLKELYIYNNLLTSIESISFKGLVKLDSLLEKNLNFFKELSNLERLSIYIDDTTEINLNIFEKLKNIIKFFNQLSFYTTYELDPYLLKALQANTNLKYYTYHF